MRKIGNSHTEEVSSRRSDSSTDRVLGLLDLFTPDQPSWTADSLMAQGGMARATVYRYLKALTEAGFLAPIGNGAYGLGPRVIEMDRQIRIADPLLQVAPPVMHEIRDQVGGAQLLCRYYGLRVLTIDDDCTDVRLATTWDRGKPFSLFRGACSRIILANLPQAQLQKLFLYHMDEIAAGGLGTTWVDFRERMKSDRKAGYVAASENNSALIGVGAPIYLADGVVTASLTLVRFRRETDEAAVEALRDLAMSAAERISTALQRKTAEQGVAVMSEAT